MTAPTTTTTVSLPPEDVVELAELGLQRNPKGEELRMAYSLLADLYHLTGDLERAAEYARLAEQVAASGGGER